MAANVSGVNLGVGGPASVRFLSWNIKGLNNPVKRSRVFSHVKKLGADVVFLQESHLRIADHTRLRHPGFNQVFHSDFNYKARGVAILISRKVQFSASGVISDKNGRYLIITGKLWHTPVVLVNVYAPNFDDVGFARCLLGKIPNLNSHRLIFGGDLNCVVDPALDRSAPNPAPPSAMSRTFSDFMAQTGCADPWRFRNPQAREYSFFSHVHHSYSRIDYFFVDPSLLPKVTSSDYLPIVISDHCPVTLDIALSARARTSPHWRLNSLLLSDAAFCTYVSSSIDVFLSLNRSDSTSHSLLWETLKAYLRGQIISYSSHLYKTRRAEQDRLSKAILDLDRQYAAAPSPELYKQRLNLQSEFNLLTTDEAERLLLHSRGTYYEHGDKASRLLAHQLKRRAASRLIPQITDSSGALISDPAAINDTFKSFYSSLYKSEFPPDPSNMERFLGDLATPSVDAETATGLDSPLILNEVSQSIMSMQSGKAPGPDGFPTEFFKKFHAKLAPLLLSMYNESLERGSLPPTLTQASIALLLKKGKDPALCSSFRPLSLLNVDVKILAKVIATRLEAVLPGIISEEQTGFIKDRHSFFNIRTLFNVIYSKQVSNSPEVVISLDAEKAFDRVEWEYLFAVLDKFGFGNKFSSWIRLLYSAPQATVCTNDSRSSYFPLERGTRQGCPLSPLLFALAIEPLSIALRSSASFRGIVRGGVEHRLSLYADDLLLYVDNPAACLPSILSILENFGSFSGYKLNLQKSECFPINSAALQLRQTDLPFALCRSGFKYLGVNVTRSWPALFSSNFAPLLTQMKSDFQRWGSLPLSLIGRINAVKMNSLPKFLYLFQSIPLFLPKSFFKSINQAITKFIWGGRSPRVGRSLLQRCKFSGGLALPNFLYYYWAANFQKLSFWFHASDNPWCHLEARSCISSSLPALLCSSLPTPPSRHTGNPVALSSLKIWYQFRRHFKLLSASSLGPIENNHLFPPSLIDNAFSFWKRRGINTFRDLYSDGVFPSFPSLAAEHALPPSHLFRYFQVRHFVSSRFPGFPALSAPQPWEDLLTSMPGRKAAISLIYSRIMSLDQYSTSKTKSAWGREMGVEFADEWWEEAIDRVRSTTSCARLGLIQFKVLHRVHYSKSRLSEIYPNVSDECDRCHVSPCNLTHMFAHCPKLRTYWDSIFKILSDVLEIDLQPCPRIAVFGVPEDLFSLAPGHADVVAFASLLARRRILLQWRSPHSPSVSRWLQDLIFFLKLEKIKYSLRGCSRNFSAKWQPFISYFHALRLLPPEGVPT